LLIESSLNNYSFIGLDVTKNIGAMRMSIAQKTGQKACDLVKEYEEKQGRTVEKAKLGSGYDLISKKGEDIRKIEVKADTGLQVMGKHAYALTVQEWQVFSADKKSWLYIVFSLDDHPKLARLQSSQISLHQIKIIAPQINIRFSKDDRARLKTEDLS